MHRLNEFAYNLMYVLEITSYDAIYPIASHFLTIKQIGDKYFSQIFNFVISALI